MRTVSTSASAEGVEQKVAFWCDGLHQLIRHISYHVVAAVIAGVIIGIAVDPFISWLFSTSLHGVVCDAETDEVIPRASVFVQDGERFVSDVTDSNGRFELDVRRKSQRAIRLTVLSPYYEPLVDAPFNASSLSSVALIAIAQKGYVKDSSGRPVAEAKVCVAKKCTTTDQTGLFRLPISKLAIGAIIRIVAAKGGARAVQDVPFSREAYQTIQLDVGPIRWNPPVDPPGEAWAALQSLVNRGDDSRTFDDYGRSFDLYFEAWNSIPKDGGSITNGLQERVQQAIVDYEHADFKAASDRLRDVLHEVLKGVRSAR